MRSLPLHKLPTLNLVSSHSVAQHPCAPASTDTKSVAAIPQATLQATPQSLPTYAARHLVPLPYLPPSTAATNPLHHLITRPSPSRLSLFSSQNRAQIQSRRRTTAMVKWGKTRTTTASSSSNAQERGFQLLVPLAENKSRDDTPSKTSQLLLFNPYLCNIIKSLDLRTLGHKPLLYLIPPTTPSLTSPSFFFSLPPFLHSLAPCLSYFALQSSSPRLVCIQELCVTLGT